MRLLLALLSLPILFFALSTRRRGRGPKHHGGSR